MLQTWSELKRRKAHDVNAFSRVEATLAAIAVNAISGFSGKKGTDSATPDQFLPYHLEDPNSPKFKLRQQLHPQTARIAWGLMESGKLPPQVIRAIHSVEGLYELLEEMQGL